MIKLKRNCSRISTIAKSHNFKIFIECVPNYFNLKLKWRKKVNKACKKMRPKSVCEIQHIWQNCSRKGKLNLQIKSFTCIFNNTT